MGILFGSELMDGITAATIIIRFIFAIAGMFLWGFVCKHIVKSKGYPDSENKGFWWGFFLSWIGLIVCITKQPYGDPMNRFNQFGQNNQFGQGGFNNGFGNNNGFGGYNGQQGGYQQPPTYQQPTYQQPTYQQPTYQQPTYQQPQTYQPDFSQPEFGQPDDYYQQDASAADKHYDSGAEMDGIDPGKMKDLDDMFK